MGEKTNLELEMAAFLEEAIFISNKFIDKVETGRAISKETYKDLTQLRAGARQLLKEFDDGTE